MRMIALPRRSARRALLGILCGSIGMSHVLAADEVFRVVNVRLNDTLVIRAAPNADAAVRGKIPANAKGVVKTGECKDWCLVRYNRVEGWVNKRFLALDEATTAEEAIPKSTTPFEDCNSNDAARQLSGCTALITRSNFSASDLAVAYSRRSDAQMLTNGIDKAIADRAKALQLQPGDETYKGRLSYAYQLRAEQHGERKAREQALADYAEAIRVDPLNHDARLGRSNIYLTMNNVDKAIDELQPISGSAPAAIYRIWLARLYDRRAIDQLLKTNIKQAITDYTSAINLDPANASLFINRAAAHAAANDSDGALKDYAEAIRLKPDHVEAHIRRSEIYYARSELLHCIADLNEALQLEPRNVDALMLRGLAREANEQPEYARIDYRTILRVDAGNKLAKQGLERASR